MRPIRSAALLSGVLLASAVAAPSATAFSEGVNTGDTGFYTINDDASTPATVCRYEANPGTVRDEVDKVIVKRMWTHGPYVQMSWVGQRIVIRKNRNPSGGGGWKTVYRSPVVKGRADQTEVMIFPARKWRAPENSRAFYRAQVILYYYALGSRTALAGRVRGLTQFYRHKMMAEPSVVVGPPTSYCRANFHTASS